MKKISCDFSVKLGRIRPQHGIVDDPYPSVMHPRCSLSSASAELAQNMMDDTAFPMLRLKGRRAAFNGRTIDVPYIFHDMRKDPKDYANYDFIRTDELLLKAKTHGWEIMYHLGAPYEYFTPLYSVMPSDVEKFAEICLRIVERYNEGLWGGQRLGIRYWEIWHRADDLQCFSGGTSEDYYRLYETVARKIKAKYPDLKVGGPAAAFCEGDNAFLKGFLSYVKENAVPCDFVTWNYYGDDPKEAYREALLVKELVTKAELGGKVEIMNDEWQCMTYDETRRFNVKDVRNMRGAAFDAAFMINMQKAGMDASLYYGGESRTPWGGLTDFEWIKPLPPLYAMYAFSQVFQMGNETKSTVEGDNTYALCGSDGNKNRILVSVYEDSQNEIRVETGLGGKKTVFMLSDDFDLRPVLETEEESFIVHAEGYAVFLIEAVEQK